MEFMWFKIFSTLILCCAITTAYAQFPADAGSLQIIYNNNQTINLEVDNCKNRVSYCINLMLQSAPAQLPAQYAISQIIYSGPGPARQQIGMYNGSAATSPNCDINQVFSDMLSRQPLSNINPLRLAYNPQIACIQAPTPVNRPASVPTPTYQATPTTPVNTITATVNNRRPPTYAPKDDMCGFANDMSGARPVHIVNGREVSTSTFQAVQEANFKRFSPLTQDDPALGILIAQDYDYGTGTNQDRKKATELDIQSANAGVSLAQYVLGYRYAYGIGADKNLVLAKEWLNKFINTKITPPNEANYNSPIISYFFPHFMQDRYNAALRRYKLDQENIECGKELLNNINNNTLPPLPTGNTP
jgi:hypothetical protein